MSARADVPSGRGELVQLAQVFDQMAEALEQREAERQRAERTLRQYADRLMEVQESERRHIARELHDEIGQALTAVKMNLQAAQRLTDEPTLLSYQQDCVGTVERTLHQVRSLSLDLRPSILDDLGLVPALRWLVARQARQTGLSIQFVADPLDERLPPDLEIACFRMVQEALTNIVRHAQAEQVQVELRRREGEMQLSVRDDGVGFDVQAALESAAHGASLGLLGMRERVSARRRTDRHRVYAGTWQRGSGALSGRLNRRLVMTSIRVLIAEDHALVRAGFRALLQSCPGIKVVGETGDGREAVQLVKETQPDVILMDISMPGMNGLEATAHIVSEYPNVRVIILVDACRRRIRVTGSARGGDRLSAQGL